MSNSIVPLIYRTVIDDVIAAIKPEFEEAGIAQDILAELQHRWEDKVIASRVADFEPPPLPPVAAMRRMHQYSPFLSPSGQPMPHYTFPYINANRPMSGPAEEILPFPPGSPGEGPHIPQIDGPPDDSQDSMKYTSHPPRPEPLISPSEAITSDLDDLETDEEDAEDGVGGSFNTAFCNYDKVSRKKTKWKCVLNNGVIHANGKDYLFSKCTGEFDWE
ncbi:transcription factor IIA alpha/beta subunit [Mycena olivaceomarginata]|nr:transcription factor IIA alpha/beta subunit [Mycena olivaceomarginata]KAJ7893934.1 transcription factor IIA alpha/beta subunit [Mycena olivaceomarginata]